MIDASPPISRALAALSAQDDLGEQLTMEAFDQLMRGDATPAQAAALLMGLSVKGETADEVTGASRALRHAMVTVETGPGGPVIDTCGTGGGAVTTFNISTAAAIVAVSLGTRVAKHGNRSYTSRCGSADLLDALGLPTGLPAAAARQMLETAGMVFLFAPLYHPAMRFVAPVRRELGVATLMNVIGPLANPARVRRQVVGVADAHRGPILAAALQRLGAEHALVVHAEVGMDEIAATGTTTIWEVRGGELRTWRLSPADYGLDTPNVAALAGGEPADNAERVRRLFDDPRDDEPGRATVVLNAAAALYVAGAVADLFQGVELAASAVDEGRAADALTRLRQAGIESLPAGHDANTGA